MEHITTNNINLKVSLDKEENLIRKLEINGFTSEKNIILNFEQHESKFFGTIVLAFILFIIAYTEFFSIMSVLKSIF